MSDVEAFFAEIKKLHIAAGKPTTRDVQMATGVNRTTVAQVLRGDHLPKLNTMGKIVECLGGDSVAFKVLWGKAAEELAGREPRVATMTELQEIHEKLDRILKLLE